MYGRPSPLETVAQAEASAVIPHSDPSPKLEFAPSIPQNPVSWEPRCRKLFRSFSVNAEKELAEVGRFIRFLRPGIRS
ncbi:hypothetical protein M405DRAFT_806131 [Rhizopogon salebrosus TDB-379]|nr:hypothetical protein M405DRAFT_806131 [Rhizopogon salebrosus TDB-379]